MTPVYINCKGSTSKFMRLKKVPCRHFELRQRGNGTEQKAMAPMIGSLDLVAEHVSHEKLESLLCYDL